MLSMENLLSMVTFRTVVLANRTEGIVGKGSGSVIFTDSAKYYQQGIAFIDTTTGIMKLNSDSSVTFKPSNVLEITSGNSFTDKIT